MPQVDGPNYDQTLAVRVLLGIAVFVSVANVVFQAFEKPFKDPNLVGWVVAPCICAVVYEFYRRKENVKQLKRTNAILAMEVEHYHRIARLRGLSIMLIEDNPLQAQTTRWSLLRHEITNVSTVPTAELALQMLRREGDYAMFPLPDLILLDLGLPGMTGKQFLDEIKNDPDLYQLKIIVLTARSREMIEGEILESVSCFVDKGQGPTALISAIESCNAGRNVPAPVDTLDE